MGGWDLRDLARRIFERFDLPKLEDVRRLLVVAPHPDDAEIGAGGTVSKLAMNGAEVRYLVVTDGMLGSADVDSDPSEVASIRRSEQEKAASFLGVEEVHWLGLHDLGDYTVEELRTMIIRRIREIGPEIVMAPDPYLPYESHPDHRKVGTAALEAVFMSDFPTVDRISWNGRVGVLGVALYYTHIPNEFVCLGGHFERKIEALRFHESQFSGELLDLMVDYLSERAAYFGSKVDCKKAEDFRVIPRMMLHIFPEVAHL